MPCNHELEAMVLPTLTSVRHYIAQLKPDDQRKVLQWLQDILLVRDLPQPREVREARFRNGVECPHCQGRQIYRWGRFRGRQRYRCRSCNRTFNDFTGTPLARSRYQSEWLLMARYMMEGLSLRKTARRMAAMHGTTVHFVTLFYWRHKVLRQLQEIPMAHLEGIVECDEMYVRDNIKSRKLSHRPSWRLQPPPRGISQHQVCILTARDRNRRIFAQAVGVGRIRDDWLRYHLAPVLGKHITLVTDAEHAYRRFVSSSPQVRHIALQQYNEVVGGVYHIQNINAYHSRLRKFLGRFRGVATHYLNGYLAWFNFVSASEVADLHAEGRRFLFQAMVPAA